jgi:lysophosphatidylglycerol acyltransferase 1
LYYRRYRAEDVPCDQEGLTSWLYDRWQEKDNLLEKFYASGDKASFENESETLLKVDVVKCLAVSTVSFISTLFHLYMIRSLVGGVMQILF